MSELVYVGFAIIYSVMVTCLSISLMHVKKYHPYSIINANLISIKYTVLRNSLKLPSCLS